MIYLPESLLGAPAGLFPSIYLEEAEKPYIFDKNITPYLPKTGL
jgi:hypothetical protein